MPPIEGLRAGHPLLMVSRALKVWLGFLILVLFWNSCISNPVLFRGVVRPIPYLIMMGFAVTWFLDTWHSRRVLICSSVLAVGLSLRGLEVLVFFDGHDMRNRLTAASVWTLIGATALVFGIMNGVAISRATTSAQHERAMRRGGE